MEILLILTCLGWSGQDVAKKMYARRCAKGDLIFSAASTLVALLFFLLKAGGDLSLSSAYLPYSIGFGISYSLFMICSVLAVRSGPLALTALVLSCSLLLPTMYGLFILQEPLTFFLITGIILLLMALVLINFEEKVSKQQITAKWLTYVFLAFIGNGACSILQKAQQIAFAGSYENEFMVTALLLSCIVLGITAVHTEKGNILISLKTGLPWYTLCGAANGIVNLLVMTLAQSVPASLMFPIISAGNIVITFSISVIIFKERLSKWQLTGVFLGILAVIFLNI